LFRVSQKAQTNRATAATQIKKLVIVKRLLVKRIKAKRIRATLVSARIGRYRSESLALDDSASGAKVHSRRWIAQPSKANAPI
jgi:hypothetical protein